MLEILLLIGKGVLGFLALLGLASFIGRCIATHNEPVLPAVEGALYYLREQAQRRSLVIEALERQLVLATCELRTAFQAGYLGLVDDQGKYRVDDAAEAMKADEETAWNAWCESQGWRPIEPCEP